jgi:hypothetical protein
MKEYIVTTVMGEGKKVEEKGRKYKATRPKIKGVHQL